MTGPWVAGTALHTVRQRWRNGRPLVLVLGSGISVGSGIPLGRELADHLVRVDHLAFLKGWPKTVEFLRAEGWPSRHETNAELLARYEAGLLNPAAARGETFETALPVGPPPFGGCVRSKRREDNSRVHPANLSSN
jgi:hypothetical protein